MSYNISADEIQVWTWQLDVSAEALGRAGTILSDDEKARASRFVFERHANLYRVGRSRLREILSSVSGIPAADLQFEYGAHGKPALSHRTGGDRLKFNMSHSEDLAALAISDGPEIGIDIEWARPVEDDVAKANFSAAEYSELSRLQGDDWLDAFYRCWTRKEAIVKALGDGLTLPLDAFDVTIGAHQDARVLQCTLQAIPASCWGLWHFQPDARCMGAIAARTDGAPVRVRHMTPLGDIASVTNG